MFNGSRLILARKRRGLTKKSLAEKLGITDRSIFDYENLNTIPEDGTIDKISKVLNFPIDFFESSESNELKVNEVSFRSLSRIKAYQRDMALTSGELALSLTYWIESKFDLPAVDLPLIEGFMKPESAAILLRDYWDLSDKPLKNIISLVESKGVRVLSIAVDSQEVDAFSFWRDNTPYIFLNKGKTAERLRFDVAHELGHLIIHRDSSLSGRIIEREADQFASAFLMPASSVFQKISNQIIDFETLVKFKKIWNVSAAALNYRLNDLGIISEWNYRSLCIDLSKFGRNKEPEPTLTYERSLLLEKVFKSLYIDGFNLEEISNELNLHISDINEYTFDIMDEVYSRADLSKNKKLYRVK